MGDRATPPALDRPAPAVTVLRGIARDLRERASIHSLRGGGPIADGYRLAAEAVEHAIADEQAATRPDTIDGAHASMVGQRAVNPPDIVQPGSIPGRSNPSAAAEDSRPGGGEFPALADRGGTSAPSPSVRRTERAGYVFWELGNIEGPISDKLRALGQRHGVERTASRIAVRLRAGADPRAVEVDLSLPRGTLEGVVCG